MNGINDQIHTEKERQKKFRESLQGAEKKHFQDKDALRRQIERENQPKEKSKLRKGCCLPL